MELFLIVDGSYHLARCQARLGHLTSSDGFPTGGVYGQLQMDFNNLVKIQPDYCCIVYDRPTLNETPERCKIYAEYKGNRVAETEEDKQKSTIKHRQRQVCKDVFNMCGIKSVFSHKGWEADDTIASLAVRAEELGHRVLILTGDKDIAQLVTSKIRVLDTKLSDGQRMIVDYWKEAMTPQLVEDKFGVPPSKIAELLAIHGDAVDGVPGIKGITRETAAELLGIYGSIKGVCSEFNKDNPRGIIANFKRAELLGDAKFLKRNLSLVRLNTDLISAEKFDIDKYKINLDNQKEEARKYLQTEFGFKDLPQNAIKFLSGSSSISTLKHCASMFD